MSKFITKTASAQQIQRQYRFLFDQVMTEKEPLVVLNKNKPEVVIIDIGTFEYLKSATEQYEEEQAKKAVSVYQKEKKSGGLKKLNSLADIMT